MDSLVIHKLVVCGLCFLGTAASGWALEPTEQWGHWRGPTGNGSSATAQPPVKFGEEENLKWKVAIPGRGSGSPVVWGDKVFVVTAVPQGAGNIPKHKFNLLCLSRSTGEILWQQTAAEATPGEVTHKTNSYASASPCTDGQHVYASFCSQGVYCYTLDGELVWKRNDFGQMTMRSGFGEGSSPTLVDDMLILPWDHEGPSFLYALNKLTGETLWKTPRDEPSCWATPLIVSSGGSQQIVMNGQNSARGYDLKSGKELWRCAGQTDRPAASAVAADGLVFVGSGYRGSFLGAFRVDGRGDLAKTKNVVWSQDHDTPDIASPLLSQGRLYFHKGKSGALSCVDAKTGKPLFPAQRIPELGDIYASPLAAGGHVYLFDRDGTVVVIKDAGTLEIVATNSLGETIDATPAAVGNELIVRGEKHLFCFAK